MTAPSKPKALEGDLATPPSLHSLAGPFGACLVGMGVIVVFLSSLPAEDSPRKAIPTYQEFSANDRQLT